jgi:4-hydroxy-tetrahydrodipicolinate reductase
MLDMKTYLAVNGSCGRMGQRLIALAKEDPEFVLSAALEAPGHPHLGKDVGELVGIGRLGLPLTSELNLHTRVDVVVDFSQPEGTIQILKDCVMRRLPVVIATTGHNSEQRSEIEAAAHETAVLLAPNMSLVVNVLFKLTQLAAELLKGRDYDVEIVERHHRFKKDSPSGTALHFAEIIQGVQGQTRLRHGREGLVGQRPSNEIGLHAIRAGDNVGEHTIIFSTLGETLELVHRAHSRDAYARGALQAAKYLAGRPPGRYTMFDVLGI